LESESSSDYQQLGSCMIMVLGALCIPIFIHWLNYDGIMGMATALAALSILASFLISGKYVPRRMLTPIYAFAFASLAVGVALDSAMIVLIVAEAFLIWVFVWLLFAPHYGLENVVEHR